MRHPGHRAPAEHPVTRMVVGVAGPGGTPARRAPRSPFCSVHVALPSLLALGVAGLCVLCVPLSLGGRKQLDVSGRRLMNCFLSPEWEVSGLIPGQGTYLGCGLILGRGVYRKQPIRVSLSSPSLLFYKNKYIKSLEKLRKSYCIFDLGWSYITT